MIDHLAMEVRDYRHSKDFYLAAVAPLGCELLMSSKDGLAVAPLERARFRADWHGHGAETSDEQQA